MPRQDLLKESKESITKKLTAFSSHPDFTVGFGFEPNWLALAGYTAGRNNSF